MADKTFKIGAALALDGEKEFKAALKDINTEMKALQAQSKLTSAEYEKNTATSKKLADAYDDAGKKVDIQKKKVDELKTILQACKDQGLDKNSAAVIKYTNQLAKAETDLKKFTDEEKNAKLAMVDHGGVIGDLKDKYKSIKEGVNDAKAAMPNLTKAAEKATDGVKKLGSVLADGLKAGAKASAAAIGAVTAGAVAMSKAVYDAASDAAEYGDNVDKMSQKLGMSAEGFQEWDHVLKTAGTSMNDMQTGMKTFSNQIGQAGAGTEKSVEAFKKLGISMDELNGMTREEAFEAAIKGLQGMEDSTERAALANQLFGKSGQNLTPLFNETAESTAKLREEAEQYGLVMSDAAVKASAAFEDTKTLMVDTVTSIKNNLAAELLPGINEIMEGITGLFTGDEGAAEKISEGLDTLMENIGEVVGKVGNILTNMIGIIGENAPELVNTLVTGITENLDEVIDVAMTLVDTLANSLLTEENISAIMNGAVSLITKLVTFLADNAELLVNAAVTIVTTLIDAFADPSNSSTIIHGCIDMMGAIVTALIDNAPQLIDSAIEMGKQLVAGLISYDWSSLARNIYNSIKNAIIGFFKSGGSSSDGGHAGGLDFVPYNGYSAILHRGERIQSAAEAQADRNNGADNYTALEAKIDYLLATQKQGDVNVNISGSAGAVVRALNIEIEREGRRKSAFA